jgi:hypothetical protein
MAAISNLSHNPHGTVRRRSTTSNICSKITKIFTLQRILLIFIFFLGFVYIQFSIQILKGPTTNNKDNNGIGMGEVQQQRRVRAGGGGSSSDNDSTNKLPSSSNKPKSTYFEWKKYAVELAGMTPEDIVNTLKKDDPFGVRTFEAKLLETESEKERFLSLTELQDLFPCPTSTSNGGISGTEERITLPDQRDHNKAEAFRNGTVPYFLFFQHLRKAGGTNFCSLAENNLLKAELPKYYCSACTVIINLFVIVIAVKIIFVHY